MALTASNTGSANPTMAIAVEQTRSGWGTRGKDMSDLYDKVREDIARRKMLAEKSAYGFELPSVALKPKKRID